MRITGFCIQRPITTAMFFLALIVLGFLSASKMPIDLFPQITYPAISISTNYSGAGPEEIERLITIPIEQSVSTVNQVKSITSNSQEGQSRVTVNFNWGMNLDTAASDIRAIVDRARGRLPDEADAPTVFKYDPSMSPILTLGLSGRLDEVALRKLAEDDLSYLLQRADGVARVDVRGGKLREIRVFLKQDRLQSLGLTADQVATVLKNENVMSPAGHLAVGVGDFLLRAKGEFQSIQEIRNLVVASRNGIPVYLRDIASIEDGFQTTQNYVRIDGKPGIVISISKRSGSNTVNVVNGIYKALDEIRTNHPDITLRVLNDDSIYIRRAVNSVFEAGMIGAVLATLILLFFFHNLRATLITGIAIPISIMVTLMIAYFFKMTLNTISLGGLALGVGMLVDNGVVVLDNIFRHHQRDNLGVDAAALSGTAEMGPALSASTLTHICVFFPLIYLTGRNGIIFKDLSYMVIFSILCSLLVAVTIIPMLCAKFLKVKDMEEVEDGSIQGFLIRLQHGWEKSYEGTLAWCLRHKRTVIITCTLIFASTCLLLPFIGSELVQNTDEGVISLNLQLPTGTRLEETDFHSQNLERNLKTIVPELANMEVSVGGSNNSNQSRLTLRLKPRDKRKRTTQEVVDDLQKKVKIPGARIRVTAQSSMRFLYGGSQYPLVVDVRGYDQLLTRQVAITVQEKMGSIPGVTNTNMSREEERPELALSINRKRAADYGITAAQIATAIETNIAGKVATIFRKAGEETQVRVNLQESDRKSWQDLGRILVSGSNGLVIPLSSLVDLSQTNSPVGIERKDQERNIAVSASLSQRDLGKAMTDLRREVDKIPLPSGVTIHYAGDYEEQQSSFNELTIAFILSLFLVYMVMAAQFESFFDPFVIILAIPFALGGVFLILLLTNTNFNSQVYIGLIMLGGIVVNNTIVLISYIRILLDRGLALEEAVLKGARARLRPILITSATTLLGLTPLALGLGEGGETQSPLARTVIGGLMFSTVLSLVLIPVIFAALEGRVAAFRRHKPKRHAVIALILCILLSSVFALPSANAAEPEARKLAITDAVALALSNGEEGRIIRQQRLQAEAAYRESIGLKKLRFSTSLELTATDDNVADLLLNAEKSLAPLAIKIAERNRVLALLTADLREQALIYNVAVAFQNELLTQRQVKIAEEGLARNRRFQEEIQTRSQLGLTTASDEIGAAAQVAGAETTLNRSRQLFYLARVRLRQHLGLDEKEPLALIAPENPKGLELADLQLLQQEALAKRAEGKAAQTSWERAGFLLELARIAVRNGITLAWTIERNDSQAGFSLSNQTGSDGLSGEWRFNGNVGWTVREVESTATYPEWGALKLTYKWNLADRGVRRERIKQAELVLAQAEEERKKQFKSIGYDLMDAYYNLQNQRDRLQSGALQLQYMQTLYEATLAKMRVGLASPKEVLDTQLLLQTAESDYERIQAELYLAGINLKRAYGALGITAL